MQSETNSFSYRVFDTIAQTVIRRPWFWVVFWLICAMLALPGNLKLKSVLQGANGGLAYSEALKTKDLLKERFHFPFTQSYLIVLESQDYRVQDAVMRQNIEKIQALLEKEPDTETIQHVYNGTETDLMQSKDGHKTFILVGQSHLSVELLEKRTGEIRQTLKPLVQALQQTDASLKVFMTGMNAIVYDINSVTSKSTEQAEGRVLIFTLILLLLAFGSITGAFLPGLIAVFANLVGLGIIYQIALNMPVSIYAQTISTMIGLAVGIDYALLVVWRLREERIQHEKLVDALRVTMIHAGKSVFFAGFTFALSLAGLFFTGITSLFSIGLGGAVIVILSILLSLTLLPALILILDKWLEFPRFLSARLAHLKPSQLWEPLSFKIMAKPIRFAVAAIAFVTLLSSPALKLHIGEFDIMSLPDHLESKQGFSRLGDMSVSGVMVPIFVVIGTQDNSNILTPQHLEQVQKIHQILAQNPLMERVYSLVGNGQIEGLDALLNQLPFLQMAFPHLFDLMLSQDQTLTLVQVIPKNLKDYEAQIDYIHEFRQKYKPILNQKGLDLYLGGSAALTLDYNLASFKNLLAIVIGIVILTYLVLLWALRSYLIALKAVLLNLCSVAVSYGVITMIFQFGWMPGVQQTSIMAYIPLLLFCIIFGMSIDYEVFLMSRIKEEHEAGYDNEQATARGIRATGDVITYAALIMCIVFGAFTMVEISIIKQLGFGLATAIFVDATLIRMILVPAFMKVAGKWNWYPGK